MHQEIPDDENTQNPKIYQELNKSFYAALDKYTPQEREREKIIHNPLMVVAAYGLNSGCTLPEVVGSFVTAVFELMHLAMFVEDMDEGEENDATG